MLKKDLTVSGAKVTIFQCKSGVPDVIFGDPLMKNFKQQPGFLPDDAFSLQMTHDPGSILDGFVRIGIGEILTIVDGPAQRGPLRITTVVVRRSNGDEGHVYWCDLRLSAKHV